MTRILVTGASGHLGRLVVKHLLETGNVPPASIVAGSRDPSKLADLAALGVETRAVDFDKEDALPEAFAGIDRLLIISTDSLDTPGKRVAQHSAAARAAGKAGVKRIGYTSIPKPDTSAISFAWEHRDSEAAITKTGAAHTFFRNGWYMENLFMSVPQAIQTGTWHTSADTGGISYIAREDVARAIAASLAGEQSGNAVYTLTGSRPVFNAEAAALASEATGKPIAVDTMSDENYTAALQSAGLPGFLVDLLVSTNKATRNGDLGEVTDDFKRLTGRDPVRVELVEAYCKAQGMFRTEDFIPANAGALAG